MPRYANLQGESSMFLKPKSEKTDQQPLVDQR
jgi:hypothetical protein